VKTPNCRKIDIRSEQGQSVTEFALVLPILALLLFAVIQFGITFNNYVTLTDATRAGARKAAIGRQLASTWQPGADVTVTATYPYKISLLGLVVKTGRLSSTTTERVE